MKHERHTITRFVIGMAACLMATGCSDELVGNTPIGAEGIPEFVGERTRVEGVVHLMGNGCWALRDANDDQRWIIWPSGSKPTEDGAAVFLPNGDVMAPEAHIVVDGQLLSRTDLPEGDNPDSMWGAAATYCLSAAEQPAELLCAEEVRASEPD